jgi:hypothetical protein
LFTLRRGVPVRLDYPQAPFYYFEEAAENKHDLHDL